MKYRTRISVIRVIEADDADAANELALEAARGLGMDPEVEVLGIAIHSSMDVHSTGAKTQSTMR